MKGDPFSSQKLLEVNSLLGAFLKFLTLPNYLSVTILNYLLVLDRLFLIYFLSQRKSTSRPELIERVLCCTLLCCTLTAVLNHYARL